MPDEVATVTWLTLPDPLPTDGPLVSVLIPSYNYDRFVGVALRSVLDQTYRNLEIIVIDDCSTDRALDVIRFTAAGDPRVTIHSNEKNLGNLANFARCYELATGIFIKPLTSDDRLHPSAISSLVAAMESDPEVTLAWSRRELITETGALLAPASQPTPISPADMVIGGRVIGELILRGLNNFIGEPSTVLWRRDDLPLDDDFYRIGGYSPSSVLDLTLFLKLLAKGSAAYLVTPLSQFRRHTGQYSHSLYQRPSMVGAWHSIIQGARQLGYLESPSDELASLRVLVGVLGLGDIGHFGIDVHAELKEMLELIREAIGRIGELANELHGSPTGEPPT